MSYFFWGVRRGSCLDVPARTSPSLPLGSPAASGGEDHRAGVTNPQAQDEERRDRVHGVLHERAAPGPEERDQPHPADRHGEVGRTEPEADPAEAPADQPGQHHTAEDEDGFRPSCLQVEIEKGCCGEMRNGDVAEHVNLPPEQWTRFTVKSCLCQDR